MIGQIPVLQLKELENAFIGMVHQTLSFLNPKWFKVFNTTLQREKKYDRLRMTRLETNLVCNRAAGFIMGNFH